MTSTATNVYDNTLASQATTNGVWRSDPIDVTAYDTLILSFVPTQFTSDGYIGIERIDVAGRADQIVGQGVRSGDSTPVWLTVGPSDSYSSTSAWGQHVHIIIGSNSGDTTISGRLCMDGRG